VTTRPSRREQARRESREHSRGMRLDALPALPAPDVVHVVVETPRHSIVKLKYDPDLDQFVLKRPLPLGFAYPYDWGFVPETVADDGDPLDALVVWEAQSPPGTVLRCRPLGVLQLSQRSKGKAGRVRNDRILVVPQEDPRTASLRQVTDLPQRIRDELAHFFLTSIHFEPKEPEVVGWAGPAAALALVRRTRRALVSGRRPPRAASGTPRGRTPPRARRPRPRGRPHRGS
jgi:inorganic pyrophosphatase